MATLSTPPIISHATDRLIRVCLRLDSAGTATVRVGTNNSTVTVSAEHDFCGHAEISGLDPGTRYAYEVEIGGALAYGPVEFMTLPEEGEPGAFGLFGIFDVHDDFNNFGLALPILQQKRRDGTALACFAGGDFEFQLSTGIPLSLSQIRTFARTGRIADGIAGSKARFLAGLPLWQTWDDWDSYSNNGAGMLPATNARVSREDARQVNGEYFSGAPFVHPLAVYKSVRIADCLLMLLDNRCFRVRNPGTIDWDDTSNATLTYSYLDENPSWGAEQLQWIKDTLLANADAPFKFIVNGCTLVDACHSGLIGISRRDSMGIYHRKERHNLLAWLTDHPDVARGCVFFTGDDHHPCFHVPTEWRDQEPLIAGTTPAVTWPSHRYLPVPEVKFSPFGFDDEGSADLGAPWFGSPHEVFNAGTLGVLGLVEVDTTKPSAPRAKFRWISLASGDDLYSCEMVGGTLYYRQSRYRSNSSGLIVLADPTYEKDGETSTAYAPRTSPGTLWTTPPAVSRAGTNPGFELGNFTGWLAFSGATVVDSPLAEGHKSAQLRGVNSGLGPDVNGSLMKKLDLGTEPVRISFKVRHEDDTFAPCPLQFLVDPADDGSFAIVYLIDAVPASGWRTITYDFTPVAARCAIWFLLDAPTSLGIIRLWIDDLRVLEGQGALWAPDAPPSTVWS